MPFPHLPPLLATAFARLAHRLDKRSDSRLPRLPGGPLFAAGRRTVTSWLRAGGVADEFRPAYTTVCAAGRRFDHLAITIARAVRPPLAAGKRLTVAINDTPTRR